MSRPSDRPAKQLRRSFNILDILIIVALLAAIAAVALRYNVADKIGLSSRSDEVEISFSVMGVRNATIAAFKNGDTFYWKENGMLIGKLKETTYKPAEVYIEDQHAPALYKSENPDKIDVSGVFTASGIMTDDGFMLGGTQFIAPGKYMFVQSENIEVSITITDIQVVG